MGKQLSPFEIGQIKAHMSHGLECTAISKLVLKADGKSTFSKECINQAMQKLTANPKWRGERAIGSGAPRKTSKATDRKIYNIVKSERGKHVVSVSFLKQRMPELRPLGNTLVEERLWEAGLRYLRRRRKTRVTKEYLRGRVDYCNWVLTKRQKTIEQFAYSDGTVFYLDRDADEREHSQVAALGSHVWRQADRKDALYNDAIAPSNYQKAQGLPVRVWGLLSDGFLHVHVLDQSKIDSTLYSSLVEETFPEWMLNTKYLIQDFEKALRTEESRSAMRRAGIELVEEYPRVSQDFNAIENAWKELRSRLYSTMPTDLETRAEFVKRLLAAVRWLNLNRQDQLWYLSTNQHERARACLKLKPKGGRTKW